MRSKLDPIYPILKGVCGLLLLAGCFAYAMFQGGFVSWFLFYSVLIIGTMIVLSVLFTSRISTKRILQKKSYYAGEDVEIEIEISKRMFQPFIYLRIQDIVPANLGQAIGAQAMFFFSFSKKLSFSYHITELKRGHFEFEEMQITTSDFFGWFERKQRVKEATEMTVFPRYSQLGDISSFQTRQQTKGITAKPSYKDEDRSLSGVRNYVPGDRLTSINWKQSAKREELMTKEFETYEGNATIIAFDPYAPQLTYEAFELVVEQVASVASTFLESKIESQLAVYTHENEWIVEDLQVHTWEKGLRLLATVQAHSQTAPEAHRIYRQWANRTVFYICAQLDEAVIKTLEKLALEKADLKVCLLEMEPDQVSLAERLRHKGIEPIYMTS
ncbi:DUF58 domain-containing protein [Alkalicoccobacillus plakortidis]|uniref:DUF58 domain-containing protein n=1 Tax=Alkalicoccobacillus plakortidis TaxID=444060 RepID=A0ABT0XM07_9BACI|nr:DUF58 domain-containing protein [Alkalicoccobacillus plakortidis]MCM2676943.1 DUF58 domain-containing protein [Alkalicoccobacillus plakortidis]